MNLTTPETRDEKLEFLINVIVETIDLLCLINKNGKDERVYELISNLKHCIIILEDESIDDLAKSISLFELVKTFIKKIINKG